jgi:hypothetical protein
MRAMMRVFYGKINATHQAKNCAPTESGGTSGIPPVGDLNSQSFFISGALAKNLSLSIISFLW